MSNDKSMKQQLKELGYKEPNIRKQKKKNKKTRYFTQKEQLTVKFGLKPEDLNTLSDRELKKLLVDLAAYSKEANKKIDKVIIKNGQYTIKRFVKLKKNNPFKTDLDLSSKNLDPPPKSFTEKSSQYLKPSVNSELCESLFKGYMNAKTSQDFTMLRKTQIINNAEKETDIVIGLDFGTACTKVVIQEQGTGNAWAVPFTKSAENPYLISSFVYYNNSHFSLIGSETDKCDNLKLPLILKKYHKKDLIKIIAFVSLIIRQTIGWFLSNIAATNFPNFSFNWFYNLGLPAANKNDRNLVDIYEKILAASLEVAIKGESLITESSIINTLDNDNHSYDNYTCVCPEIQAQLEGYVRSDKWDTQKIKFMMCDIGGGTVDGSIVNVTDAESGEPKFNCLRADVKNIGIDVLHKIRLAWIKRSIELSEKQIKKALDMLLSDIDRIYENQGNIESHLASVRDYISKAEWPKDYSVDDELFSELSDFVSNIIIFVKTQMDPGHDWKSLQFILCGGGSLHPLYDRVKEIEFPTFDVIAIARPSKFIAEMMRDSDYHRHSVAYGLSFNDLGKFITSDEIKPLPVTVNQPEKSWRDNYIEN